MSARIQDIINMYEFVLAGSFVLNEGQVTISEDNNILLNKEDIVYLWVADNVIAYVGQTSRTFILRDHINPFNNNPLSTKYKIGLEILKNKAGHLDIYIRKPGRQRILNKDDVSLRHTEEMVIYQYLKGLKQGHLKCNRASIN